MHFLIRVCSKASIFSNCLDTVKSMGFVSNEHICLKQGI